ncbi:DUF4394 domain-containing protein [Steroidobacter sp. S1-65]|uniref:DUF4394 domain-containing protein n=1 Tax=Steroidobacter gossypii TaxID=2805490 RepID=A0ABS1WRP2_9GAMM|nr:DUF4394 domain-containing protein [Steroidobacter gossypii]MBM0103644.1 DUF4394 domain-containing protein [Steroidobacter gossypii]
MRLMKLGSAAVLICASFTLLSACGDNGNDESRRPQITAPDTPLPPASLGVPYSATFVSQGRDIMWSVSGSLPPGLSLDAMSGQYTGTPTTVGSYSFTITASNPSGTDSRDYTQNVMVPASDSNALLSNNRLAAFPASFPAGFENPTDITGVNDGETLVSIDRRPQNGFLYGLGYNATAGTVQLYSISSQTSVATAIGTAGRFVDAGGANVRIGADANTLFGIDFNPTVDRIRVVNSAGQNFRMNPNNGALVDGDMATPGVNMDGPINGPTVSVQETAYTNSAPNVTVTTQYTIDQTTDTICIQNPPNAGTQTVCTLLSVPVETVQGFDIPPTVTVSSSNAVAAGAGTAVVLASGRTQDELVNVNLSTGAVTTAGPLSTAGVIGIALQQPAATPLFALSADGTQLVRLLSNALNSPVTVNISGITAGETLVGIDFRPQTGQLYSFGVNAAMDNGTIYIIDPLSGTASAVGTAGSIAFVTAAGAVVDLPPASAGYGFDFNPTVDRIRVTTGTGLNFRLNQILGVPVDGNASADGINPDGSINAQPAGSTGVTGAAYTNSFGQGTGGVTTQYVIDPVSNMLFIQNPPNNGTLTAGQTITLNGNTVDFTEANGFDIPSTVRVTTASAAATGSAFAALTVGSSTRLYSIDLSNGRATDLGALPAGISGLTVGQTAIR